VRFHQYTNTTLLFLREMSNKVKVRLKHGEMKMLIPIDPNKSFQDLQKEVKDRFNITAKGFAVNTFHISLSDEIGDIMERPRDEMVEVITNLEQCDAERRHERGLEEVELRDHQPGQARGIKSPIARGRNKRKCFNLRERNDAELSLENNAELSIENERQVLSNHSRPLSRWSPITLDGVNHAPGGHSPVTSAKGLCGFNADLFSQPFTGTTSEVVTPSAEYLGKVDVFSKEAYMNLYKRVERVEAQLADFKNADDENEEYRCSSPFIIHQPSRGSYTGLSVPKDQSIFFSDNVSLAVEPPDSDRESNFEYLFDELERSSDSENFMTNLPQPDREGSLDKVNTPLQKGLTLDDKSDSEGHVVMKIDLRRAEIDSPADCEFTSADKPSLPEGVTKDKMNKEVKMDEENRSFSTVSSPHTIVDQEERKTDVDERTPDPEPECVNTTAEPENMKNEPPENDGNKDELELPMSDTPQVQSDSNEVKHEDVSSLFSGADDPNEKETNDKETPRTKQSRRSKIAAKMAERLQKRKGPRLTLEPTSRKPKPTPPVSNKRPRSRFRRNSGAYFIDGRMTSKERGRIERMNLKEGDKLEIDGHREGTIKFIGKTPFSTGTIYGLELIGGTLGENSGMVDGVRYFECREHRGVFISSSDIRKKVREPKPKEPRRSVYQRRLELIFAKHNPSKVKRVERLLDRYEEREHALYTKVCEKYSVTPEKEYKV